MCVLGGDEGAGGGGGFFVNIFPSIYHAVVNCYFAFEGQISFLISYVFLLTVNCTVIYPEI